MGSHQCPAPGCEARVPPGMLTCRPDWYRVPKPLRSAVWRAYGTGQGAGTPAHRAAITAVIDWLERAGVTR